MTGVGGPPSPPWVAAKDRLLLPSADLKSEYQMSDFDHLCSEH